jgi:3-isopropylmalate dehydrogenase
MAMTNTYRIAVIPGDGVGPEVVTQALRVLEAVSDGDFSLRFEEFDVGAARYFRGEEVLPGSILDEMASCDAIFLGALGHPEVPPGILERELLRIRQELDLYVNLRPARLLPGVPSPLAAVGPKDVDMIFVRENTEGLYALRHDPPSDATEVSTNTPKAVERIVRYAFELARTIGRSLTLVHKTNVLLRAGGLYRNVFNHVADEFPSVETAYQHVDAAALLMVTEPRRFAVIVTDNLFGDILTDLAAGISGGVGLAPSGNINPGKVSMFEPQHGSAPDLTGRGVANPIGAVMSAAMMLDHLGEEDAASRIQQAVESNAAKIVIDELPTYDAADLILEALS